MDSYARKPLFPNASRLSEIFSKLGEKGECQGQPLHPNQTLGTLVMVSGGDGGPKGFFTSFYAETRYEVAVLIKANMIPVDYDTTSFKMIVFDDCFDLYIEYGQILGSRYLCRLPLDELPVRIPKGTLIKRRRKPKTTRS